MSINAGVPLSLSVRLDAAWSKWHCGALVRVCVYERTS